MKRLTMRVRVRNTALLLMLPGFVFYTLFRIYPILSAFPYSLTDWSGIGPKTFVGLDNFVTLFTHPRLSEEFFRALFHNFQFIALNVVVFIPITGFLAYLFYKQIPGFKFFQTVIYLPFFVNAVSIGFMILLLFHPNIGLYGKVMQWVGLEEFRRFPLYGDPAWSVVFALLVVKWRSIGYFAIIIYANFRVIPKDAIEASVIEGASELQRFRYVYIPYLVPSLTNVVILSWIFGISQFEVPFVLGGASGGVGGAMDFLAIMFYRTAFSTTASNPMGMGSTIAVCMFFIISIGSVAQLILLKKRQIDY